MCCETCADPLAEDIVSNVGTDKNLITCSEINNDQTFQQWDG